MDDRVNPEFKYSEHQVVISLKNSFTVPRIERSQNLALHFAHESLAVVLISALGTQTHIMDSTKM
jgi:hypothetical protein